MFVFPRAAIRINLLSITNVDLKFFLHVVIIIVRRIAVISFRTKFTFTTQRPTGNMMKWNDRNGRVIVCGPVGREIRRGKNQAVIRSAARRKTKL